MAENKPIPIRLRPIIRHYLDELVKAGPYGKDRAEVMRRFIENGVATALEGRVVEKQDARAFGETVEEGDAED